MVVAVHTESRNTQPAERSRSRADAAAVRAVDFSAFRRPLRARKPMPKRIRAGSRRSMARPQGGWTAPDMSSRTARKQRNARLPMRKGNRAYLFFISLPPIRRRPVRQVQSTMPDAAFQGFHPPRSTWAAPHPGGVAIRRSLYYNGKATVENGSFAKRQRRQSMEDRSAVIFGNPISLREAPRLWSGSLPRSRGCQEPPKGPGPRLPRRNTAPCPG